MNAVPADQLTGNVSLSASSSSPFPSFRQGHLKPLDGLRGVAILMVILSHVFQSNTEGSGPVVRFAGNLLGYGIFGVDLFFVLSGFLITGILIDSMGHEGFFRNFYARRVLRIFPLYYGVLVLLFLLTPALDLHWNGMGWLLLGYLQNLRPAAIVNFSPGAGLGLNHLWSLAIEEQFYLVWPAAVFLVRDRRRLLWTTLGLSAGALLLRLALVHAGVSAAAIHVDTLTRADSLLLGGALALLRRTERWGQVVRLAPFGFCIAGAAVVGSIVLLGVELGKDSAGSLGARMWVDGCRYTVLAVGAAGLIAWSLKPGSACGWLFQRGWLCFFGKYSYGIYVLHMVALPLLLHVQRAGLLRLTHSKLLAVAGAGFSTMALAVLAAWLSFHLYEKPFLRLKQYFDYEAPARPSYAAAREPLDGELWDGRVQDGRLLDAHLINS